MQRRFPIGQLAATVELLGEVPWSTLPAEQQHSSLALLHKWHPEYGPDMLLSRALMLQMCRLLPAASKIEKKREAVLRRLDYILRATPDRVCGNTMMLKSMIALARGRLGEGRNGNEVSVRKVSLVCFNRQAAMWAGMGIRQQAEWQQRARHHASDRMLALNAEWETLHAELATIEGKVAVEQRTGSCLTMSSAALNDKDIECFARLWGQEEFRSAAHIQTKRAMVGTAPAPVAILPGPDAWSYRDPKMPEWAMPIIRHRGTLQGAALVIQRNDDQYEFWKLVFMVRSAGAEYLAVARMYPEDEYPPSTALHEPRSSLYHFKCNYADFSTGADVVVGPTDRLSILFRLFHNGGVFLSSDMHPISLDVVLQGQDLDIPADVHAEKKARKAAKKLDDIVIAMPWLQHLDRTEGFHGGEDALAAATRQAAQSSHAEQTAMTVMDDEQLLEALGALEKEQKIAAIEHASSGCADFKSAVRGGESQLYKSGDAVHANQARSVGKFATAWARRRGLHITFKATHGEHGQAEAKVLCRAWCHRMQFFYDLELASAEGPELVYTLAHVASYIEPTELTALAADGSKDAWAARVFAIRALPCL